MTSLPGKMLVSFILLTCLFCITSANIPFMIKTDGDALLQGSPSVEFQPSGSGNVLISSDPTNYDLTGIENVRIVVDGDSYFKEPITFSQSKADLGCTDSTEGYLHQDSDGTLRFCDGSFWNVITEPLDPSTSSCEDIGSLVSLTPLFEETPFVWITSADESTERTCCQYNQNGEFSDCTLGCTDPSAVNFNPTVAVDDGSCFIPSDLPLFCIDAFYGLQELSCLPVSEDQECSAACANYWLTFSQVCGQFLEDGSFDAVPESFQPIATAYSLNCYGATDDFVWNSESGIAMGICELFFSSFVSHSTPDAETICQDDKMSKCFSLDQFWAAGMMVTNGIPREYAMREVRCLYEDDTVFTDCAIDQEEYGAGTPCLDFNSAQDTVERSGECQTSLCADIGDCELVTIGEYDASGVAYIQTESDCQITLTNDEEVLVLEKGGAFELSSAFTTVEIVCLANCANK